MKYKAPSSKRQTDQSEMVSCYHAAGCSNCSSMSQDGFNDVRNGNR